MGFVNDCLFGNVASNSTPGDGTGVDPVVGAPTIPTGPWAHIVP